MNGLVLKKQADEFVVCLENGQNVVTKARKNLKKDGVFVGDHVVLDDENMISQIQHRKNLLVRPPLANVDRMFIVVAPVPKADLYTLDKLLIFCKLNNIEPILCVNKRDLDEKYCKEIEKIYKNLAKTIIFSTIDDSVLKIVPQIKGVCALAGQSAVGKSSIINAILGKNVAKIDTFSKKIERGKQTTRTVQLYNINRGNFLADTAGFSKLDEHLLNLDCRQAKNYFQEFLPFSSDCKYSSCQHIKDKDCGVAKAVEDGKISKERYSNYLKLYEILKNIKKY